MHAVRRELPHAQAEAAGLPPIEVPIPYPCSNADYERRRRALIECLHGFTDLCRARDTEQKTAGSRQHEQADDFILCGVLWRRAACRLG
jgi:hypothetical protein